MASRRCRSLTAAGARARPRRRRTSRRWSAMRCRDFGRGCAGSAWRDRNRSGFLKSLGTPAPTWLRLNTLRGDREARRILRRAGRVSRAMARCSSTPRCRRRRSCRHPFAGPGVRRRLVHGARSGACSWWPGCCSAATAEIVESSAGPLLDARAGVGGKSTASGGADGEPAEIDAADLSPRKLSCADHAHRLGCPACEPGRGSDRGCAAAAFLCGGAARCAVAGWRLTPPSGSHRITEQSVKELVSLQRTLLRSAGPAGRSRRGAGLLSAATWMPRPATNRRVPAPSRVFPLPPPLRVRSEAPAGGSISTPAGCAPGRTAMTLMGSTHSAPPRSR